MTSTIGNSEKKWSIQIGRAALLAALILTTFCGTSKPVMDQPDEAGSTERFVAGDGVSIRVPLDTGSFINGDYPIDNDGIVFLPLIGKVQIANQTPAQFENFLQTTYQSRLKFTELQVRPLIRISMLGGFARPGLYYIEAERSLWDLLRKAGGTPQERGLRRLRWERERKIVERDLIPYLESGESLSSIGIRSGDQIWTPAQPPKGFWEVAIREYLIRDILPLSAFALTLFISIATLNRND